MWTLKQNFREFMDGMLDDIISDLENRTTRIVLDSLK